MRRELELLRKPSPKGMRGGSLRGGVALDPCRTGVPGGSILCTGITFAAFPQVAGPRPFRSRDRVSPGGAQGVSQGGIWGWIWGSRRGDFDPSPGLEVMILHLRCSMTAPRGITAVKAKVSLSLCLSPSLSLSLFLSPLIASEERNAPRITSCPSGASVGCFSGYGSSHRALAPRAGVGASAIPEGDEGGGV